MEVPDPKESQGCLDHRDHRPLGTRVHQDSQENQGRKAHLDQKELLGQLVYQDPGAQQGHPESPAQPELLLWESPDNKGLQELQDPGAFLERRVHREYLVCMDRKAKQGMVLLDTQVRGGFPALRVPWDHLARLEWEKEVKMGFRDSQASKAIGAFQERGDQLACQAPKVLLGNEDQKALESRGPREPQASQGLLGPKVTPGLQEELGPRGLLALGKWGFLA